MINQTGCVGEHVQRARDAEHAQGGLSAGPLSVLGVSDIMHLPSVLSIPSKLDEVFYGMGSIETKPWVRKVGIDFRDIRMAVLCQRIVPAAYAFVIHTTNPSNGAAKRGRDSKSASPCTMLQRSLFPHARTCCATGALHET